VIRYSQGTWFAYTTVSTSSYPEGEAYCDHCDYSDDDAGTGGFVG
jgi:hypothetical protein